MKGVPVIGVGAVCAAGCDTATAFHSVVHGGDGLRPLDQFDCGLKQAPLCAQIDEQVLPRRVANRTLDFALNAAQQALSGIRRRKGMRIGLVFATTVGGMARSERFYREWLRNPGHIANAAAELACHEPTALAGELCRRLRLDGFMTISTACSTGLHAVGLGKRLIDRKHYDLCLAVGADALSLLTVRGFSSLLLIDPNGCKPFDRRRAGTSLGEGAGAILMATPEAANAVAPAVRARVLGWGASADAHHMTAPSPDGAGAAAAIRAAIRESEIDKTEIDLVSTHGTGTPDNDASEIAAVASVLGRQAPFCSMKRTIGHTLAASGAIEAVFSVCCLEQGVVPATGGFQEPDPLIGSAPAQEHDRPIRHVLKNSFGFGGNNAALILGRGKCFDE